MKEHPDKVVKEMIDVATKHGYGVESVRLSWLSAIPNSEVMRIEYGVGNE